MGNHWCSLPVNCVCHEQITLNYLVNKINVILGKIITPEYADPKPGDIQHSFADISLARELLDYKVEVDFFEGIKRTVEWYLKINIL